MTGCQESKGMFPFERLTSYDYLVNTTQLPENVMAWGSRLSDKIPSEEDVRQCIRDFQNECHPNLLSYLEKYLILDVRLLLEATVKVFDSFYRLADCHPIVSGKNSLSSFSSSSLQSYLMNQKSPGLFVPRHPQIYSLLKGALLGGVSLVCRTDGGTQPGEEPINAHLGYTEKAKKIIASDENTLYGSSGKHFNTFFKKNFFFFSPFFSSSLTRCAALREFINARCARFAPPRAPPRVGGEKRGGKEGAPRDKKPRKRGFFKPLSFPPTFLPQGGPFL